MIGQPVGIDRLADDAWRACLFPNFLAVERDAYLRTPQSDEAVSPTRRLFIGMSLDLDYDFEVRAMC